VAAPSNATAATDLPPAPASVAPPATAGSPPPPSGAGAASGTPANTITIATDLYRAEIDTTGGAVTQVALLKHRDSVDEKKPYLALLKTPERTFVAQAGLLGDGMPNHRTAYTALPGPRELAPGADRNELRLLAHAVNGDRNVQVLTVHSGSYLIDVAFDIYEQRRRAGRALRTFS
jgi:YidC/Oxa1 family membrane protein insertase